MSKSKHLTSVPDHVWDAMFSARIDVMIAGGFLEEDARAFASLEIAERKAWSELDPAKALVTPARIVWIQPDDLGFAFEFPDGSLETLKIPVPMQSQ